MRILSISTDRKLFVPLSDVRNRIIEYGTLFKEFHVVIFSLRKHHLKKEQLAPNVWIYPTSSLSRFFYLWDAWRIGKNLGKFGIVSGQDPFECGLVAWLISKSLKAKLQIQVHTDFLNSYFKNESIKNRIRVLLAKFLLPKADCIRVVSKHISDSLKAKSWKLKANPIVLPIFVDIEKIRNTSAQIDLKVKYPKYNFIILMASRLTKEKNIKLAIHAFKNVLNCKLENNNPLLLIVGDGPESKVLKLEVERQKIKDNVLFEPSVGFGELISYYKTCNLFLLTSKYEGYGMTLVESTAAGSKIVSSNVGIAMELLEDENIFEVSDVNSLTSKLFLALEDNLKPSRLPQSHTKRDYLEEYKKSLECRF